MRLVQRNSYCCFQQKAITSWASKICNEQTPVTPSVQRRVQRRDCRACVRAARACISANTANKLTRRHRLWLLDLGLRMRENAIETTKVAMVGVVCV